MTKKNEEAKKTITCGLIMPISSIDSYTAEHWIEVKSILTESIKSIDKYIIEVKLVSDADDIGVIQQRIVENIYTSDIVVCDVSAKNPNVMFELGMRLAFDKPTVIVIDNNTGYSFDTGVIEHVGYPKDLRFQPIIDFKNKLASKVLATYEKSINGEENPTFLKNFGTFKVAKLDETTVPADKMMLSMLSDLQRDVSRLRSEKNQEKHTFYDAFKNDKKYSNKNKWELHKKFESDNELKTIEQAIVDIFIKNNNITGIEELIGNKAFKEHLETTLNLNNIKYEDEKNQNYIDIAIDILYNQK